MAITSPTYDPAATAAALAEKYVFGQQQALTARTQRASATEKGLSSLRSAISSFQTALVGMTGASKTMLAKSAVFSDTSVGSATAKSTAVAGTYSFYVTALASAHQVSYALNEDSKVTGSLEIKVGDARPITIDLAAANTNPDDPLTPREIAAAINASDDNKSLVTASVISTGPGKYELVLTAKNTGTASAITVTHDSETDPPPPSSPFDTVKQLVPAQNAKIHIGSTSGPLIDQATNTFTGIDGVTVNFTKTTTAPVTLTVGSDTGATTANVQAFVDTYNKLKSAIDALTAPGDPSKGTAGGPFAGDSGVGALRERLLSILRPSSGDSLALYGITANRLGTLSLDTNRLNKALAANPTGLDALIGSTAGTTPTGLAGKFDTYLKGWTGATNGQLKTRQEAVTKVLSETAIRQEKIDKQYDAAYQRYLMQFTQLQALQNQMSSNSSMFDALFSSNKD
ncbi:flagellar filament capping protein FliD [Massilia sp. BSC265]|uniref:flagellar filament capping protein FliD n=1 Tax=Massilia sp. BSC265 TaxID=1549812 RepID=UPI0004E86FDE|nr:flagellar filament capping protein FliD [Massilia sp. BSC265]KFI07049.1 hypothetical protein JN27_12315 [Massilia sp. BSC265]